MSRTFKTKVGDYCKYPKNLLGRNQVLNINSGKYNDCLELHLIASTVDDQLRPRRCANVGKYYRERKSVLNIPEDVTYPTPLEDLLKYETLNNMAVNVYSVKKIRGSENQYKLGLVRLSTFNGKIGVKTVSLLRLNKKHVCLIKDLNKYMCTLCQNKSRDVRSCFFFKVCLRGFVNDGAKVQHERNCLETSGTQRIVYPKRGAVKNFKL